MTNRNGNPLNSVDHDHGNPNHDKIGESCVVGRKLVDSLGRSQNKAYSSLGYGKNNADPDTINDTLSQLRLISESNAQSGTRFERGETSRHDEPRPSTSRENGKKLQQEQMNDAKKMAERAILEAERVRARIQQPNKGENIQNIQFNNPYAQIPKCKEDEIRAMRYLDNEDDEFFHTTCHIESAIKDKIEKGKFVELDKLLQKRILQHGYKEEGRMQLINKDGVSYFVPSVDRENKIDSIKKWEQAFRVYTTIYCKANPSRAGEILQCVDIIHRAAAIFNWDNVAKYDFVFRQLMDSKPHRSWAKVYTQMWNITLNEPLKKINENSSYNNGNSKHNNATHKKKDTYCWKYNKSTCTYGRACKFEHKCSYCGIAGHPVTNCHKKHGKKSDKTKNNTSTA